MTSARRTYSDEEKAAALDQAARDGLYPTAQALGIPYATLDGWRKKAERDATPKRPGRPSALTPDVQERIIHALTCGNTIQGACELGGVSHMTYQGWITRADRETERLDALDGPDPKPEVAERESRYVAFAVAARKARAEAKNRNIELIRDAAEGKTVVREITTTKPDGTVEHRVEYGPPQWAAAAWTLERTYCSEFGRRTRTELSGQVDSRVETVTVESAEERRQAAAALRDDLAARREARHADTG